MFFDVVQNDITNMSVSAIVLPANEKLKEGSGTSRAIFEKAGRKALTNACKALGKCRIGEAVPTLAFNLDADYIIHAVVPKWVDGEHQEYDYLSAAYISALNVADIMECESIAFPLLAAGNNGFDLGLAFDIAKASIESFEGVNLKKAILVVYGDTIATFLKGKGVFVTNLQTAVIDKEKEERKLRLKKYSDEAKQIVWKAVEDRISLALEYLKDEKNREKVIQAGIAIAQLAIQLALKKPTGGKK